MREIREKALNLRASTEDQSRDLVEMALHRFFTKWPTVSAIRIKVDSLESPYFYSFHLHSTFEIKMACSAEFNPISAAGPEVRSDFGELVFVIFHLRTTARTVQGTGTGVLEYHSKDYAIFW